ncbi:Short-chain dehydrogenase/reductase SDR [Penicillium italicum]|uniref:Short-chain dehydrogenase/reductase SDR n=1 Tax=Penicillium italicum TaxID=40296 RepID=A0A0A2KU90_PENIT|nr:Short-chain dehydrogenase/reductase SDR [Penicillium italicum]
MLSTTAFRGRSFIVTGGASGIGFGIVKKLLNLSASVHVMDLAGGFSDAEASPYLDQTNRLHFYPKTDVASRETVRKTFKSILKKSPVIHGLVNCAGISSQTASIINSDEVFDATTAVNVKGVWNVGTEYLRYLLKAQEEAATATADITLPIEPPGNAGFSKVTASMVNVGSIVSTRGFAGAAAYTASKHAVLGLTRTWSMDFAPKGVRINCLAPGITDTPLLRNYSSQEIIDEHYLPLIPMRRLASPEDIANGVIFLLGDQSTYVTGEVLTVSGGFS